MNPSRLTRRRRPSPPVAMGWWACVAVLMALTLLVLVSSGRAVLGWAGAHAGNMGLMAVRVPAEQDAPNVNALAERPAAHANASAELSAATRLQSAPRGDVEMPADTPTFNGRPIRKARTLTMLTTAYSPDERSCGVFADGVTASGYSVWTNGMKLVAADTRLLPFGSLVSIPGYNDGRPVPVLDRGGKIKGHRLDVLYPTHEIARTWGAQRLTVTVWEYAD